MTNKILVSSCLLGQPVRYDGKSKAIADIAWLQQLQGKNQLVVICPEVSGGLSTPRPPAEINGETVITVTGDNVTAQFSQGAYNALKLCQTHQIKFALLKANSPSCGNKQIYDGSYSAKLISGQGVTAKLLTEHGIKVFSELELSQLQQAFN